MQYSKARPTVGIRVYTDTYEQIKKVSYERHVSLSEALDYLLRDVNGLVKLLELRLERIRAYRDFTDELSRQLQENGEITNEVWNVEYDKLIEKDNAILREMKKVAGK